ncbi:MAG: hypothetical protein JJT78_16070, partial [Leptospira sp.]|nr:hypothetical protein [Leptospira sp.]
KYLITTILLMTINCATMFKSSTHKAIYMNTSEIDSSIYVNNEKVSETFYSMDYPEKSEEVFSVRYEKSGYEPKDFTIQKRFNKYSLLNILTLALSPILFYIDYSNDALFVYRFSSEEDYSMPANPSFKENTNSATYKKFESARKSMNPKKGKVDFFNVKILKLEDSNKKDVLGNGKFDGLLPPGKYTFELVFYESSTDTSTVTMGNQRTTTKTTKTYTGKVPVKGEITIQAGILSAVCGDFNQTSNSTEYKIIRTGKPNPFLDTEEKLKAISIFPYCSPKKFKAISS